MSGDFNVILRGEERHGGAVARSTGCSSFNFFVFKHGLTDLVFQGPMYTWNRGSLFQRLDRSLCNDQWQKVATNTSV